MRPRQTVRAMHWVSEAHGLVAAGKPVLAYGNGRSYGDCCLNDGGFLIQTRPINRFVNFDVQRGLLRAEAGITLSEILDVIVPKGWFLPVTPGTRYVTLGGAIANDVHGKNHHQAGTFGNHVCEFLLARSNGEVLHCSPSQNSELYGATIGGLGLTGLILEAEIQLKPIDNPYLVTASQRFDSLDGFFALSKASEDSHEYTVAWIDGLGTGNNLGRGVFMRANHAEHHESPSGTLKPGPTLAIPLTPPFSLVNPMLMQGFNPLYFRRAPSHLRTSVTHYTPFFYPLDGIRHWNRLYGPKGFFQFQCVIPPTESRDAIRALLKTVSASRQASFLAVLKVFGEKRSPGWLSFARPGTTLALDFPNRGNTTTNLLRRLHALVQEAGGAIYPAKDACMPPDLFANSFPNIATFERWRDPAFGSSFWRRVREN